MNLNDDFRCKKKKSSFEDPRFKKTRWNTEIDGHTLDEHSCIQKPGKCKCARSLAGPAGSRDLDHRKVVLLLLVFGTSCARARRVLTSRLPLFILPLSLSLLFDYFALLANGQLPSVPTMPHQIIASGHMAEIWQLENSSGVWVQSCTTLHLSSR